MMHLRIERLDKQEHDRNLFDCGVEELNRFLKLHAHQNQKKNISITNVAVPMAETNIPKSIIGYYSLAMGQVSFDQLPTSEKSNLPKYAMPIARVGRLAVNNDHKSQGVGSFLLHAAFTDILKLSKKIGVYAVVVDAKNEKAKSFYMKFGFQELEDSGLTLFIPLNTIELA